jgi:hypothetical protein
MRDDMSETGASTTQDGGLMNGRFQDIPLNAEVWYICWHA